MADLEAVTQLIYDTCLHDGDASVAVSLEELREIWEDPDLNIETDTWVATTKEGRIVGYEEFYNRSKHAYLMGDGYVHPEYMGQGIGTALLRVLEQRAVQEVEKADPDLRVFIRNGMSMGDTVAREMHEAEGYTPIRFYWRMEVDFEGQPPAPQWPAGIELRPFDQDAHAALVHSAHMEAFRDHWGFTPQSIEEWRKHFIESSEYNPELWLIAWEGDQIAGFAICRYRMGNGWVAVLGVRRPWRKRGLGLALLQGAFGAFYQRGTPMVGLGVDASSPTGATRLYQRAGMRVASEYISYEKELRPGLDIG
jgi:mycothiol synthase